MLQRTETDLARSGFAVGATITPEMATAVRALLDSKDSLLQSIGAVEVDAQARLQAVARIAFNIHGLAVPEPECVYSLDGLEDAVLTLRQQSDVLCWMKGYPTAEVSGANVGLQPTEDQSAALGDEETTAGAIALATEQLGQAIAEYNALLAANKGGKPIMG